MSLEWCLYSQKMTKKKCVKKDIILDSFKTADSKYGLSFAQFSMVQKLGNKEPQVKKTSCLQQILNRTGFLNLNFEIGILWHQICTFLH